MTNAAVSRTVPKNPALRDTLRTLWAERWIFWARIQGTLPEETLSRIGVLVVRSGLVPVAGGHHPVARRVDRAGPMIVISSLEADLESDYYGFQISPDAGNQTADGRTKARGEEQ